MVNLFNTQQNVDSRNKNLVKVISGLDNFNVNQVVKLVKASEIALASYIDIAANPRMVSFIKSLTDLPVCVSSIETLELYNSVLAGADLVEIGNFDCFYDKNFHFSSDIILSLANEVQKLLPNINLCVTIPHILNLHEQMRLAINLEKLGIHRLQTEGFSTSKNHIQDRKFLKKRDNFSFALRKASSSLSSMHAITKEVTIPVIAASGLNSLSSSIAKSYGCAGVGIGSYIKKYNSISDMSYAIAEVSKSLHYQSIDSMKQNFYIKMNSLQLNEYSISLKGVLNKYNEI